MTAAVRGVSADRRSVLLRHGHFGARNHGARWIRDGSGDGNVAAALRERAGEEYQESEKNPHRYKPLAMSGICRRLMLHGLASLSHTRL